jgi:hypothetical protein
MLGEQKMTTDVDGPEALLEALKEDSSVRRSLLSAISEAGDSALLHYEAMGITEDEAATLRGIDRTNLATLTDAQQKVLHKVVQRMLEVNAAHGISLSLRGISMAKGTVTGINTAATILSLGQGLVNGAKTIAETLRNGKTLKDVAQTAAWATHRFKKHVVDVLIVNGKQIVVSPLASEVSKGLLDTVAGQGGMSILASTASQFASMNGMEVIGYEQAARLLAQAPAAVQSAVTASGGLMGKIFAVARGGIGPAEIGAQVVHWKNWFAGDTARSARPSGTSTQEFIAAATRQDDTHYDQAWNAAMNLFRMEYNGVRAMFNVFVTADVQDYIDVYSTRWYNPRRFVALSNIVGSAGVRSIIFGDGITHFSETWSMYCESFKHLTIEQHLAIAGASALGVLDIGFALYNSARAVFKVAAAVSTVTGVVAASPVLLTGGAVALGTMVVADVAYAYFSSDAGGDDDDSSRRGNLRGSAGRSSGATPPPAPPQAPRPPSTSGDQST